ncbi:hypothetical protein VEE57_45250 (plasmid) [Escherichia coli]|nr:hypothetical protein VEE57_45250 [Escherichia coli]
MQAIRDKGARLAVPGVVDPSELTETAEGVARIVLQSVQDMLCASPCRWRVTTTRTAASGSGRA